MNGKGTELAWVQDPPEPWVLQKETQWLLWQEGKANESEKLSALVADFQLWHGGHSESQHKIKSPKMYQKRDPFNL